MHPDVGLYSTEKPMTKNLLIVDDDPRNVFALTAVLRARGFVCHSCQSAADAIRLLKTDTLFHAILIDMMMPDMDGYDAIPRIRNIDQYRDATIIAVTAQAMTGDRERCLQAGASDYVAKPIDIDKLLGLL